MNKSNHLIAGVIVLFTYAAQASAAEKIVEFEGRDWRVDEQGVAEVRTYLNKDALFIERNMAWWDNAEFHNGVIEYDVAAPLPSGFVGVNFRIKDEANFEQFYVRFHQSGNPDATHYLPVYNGRASWQIYVGPNETTAVPLPAEEWIHVKIVVKDQKADIFVGDMEKPLLHAPALYGPNAKGGVALYAGDRPWIETSGAYFSNISARPLKKSDKIVGEPKEEPAVPETVLKSWRVSNELSENDFESALDIKATDLSSLDWKHLDVERNGVANLGKIRAVDTGDTVFVRKTITAETATTRLMKFGYSDRVRIYLNGDQLFFGNSIWRARDHRFLGTVGLHDAVALKLNKGDNEFVAVVSESFGGWAFTGQIEDQSGLTLK